METTSTTTLTTAVSLLGSFNSAPSLPPEVVDRMETREREDTLASRIAHDRRVFCICITHAALNGGGLLGRLQSSCTSGAEPLLSPTPLTFIHFCRSRLGKGALHVNRVVGKEHPALARHVTHRPRPPTPSPQSLPPPMTTVHSSSPPLSPPSTLLTTLSPPPPPPPPDMAAKEQAFQADTSLALVLAQTRVALEGKSGRNEMKGRDSDEMGGKEAEQEKEGEGGSEGMMLRMVATTLDGEKTEEERGETESRIMEVEEENKEKSEVWLNPPKSDKEERKDGSTEEMKDGTKEAATMVMEMEGGKEGREWGGRVNGGMAVVEEERGKEDKEERGREKEGTAVVEEEGEKEGKRQRGREEEGTEYAGRDLVFEVQSKEEDLGSGGDRVT